MPRHVFRCRLVLLWTAAVIAATLSSGLLAPAAARAEESPDALTKRGIELRKSGDDQGALPLFQRAYGLAPSPRSAVQLGLVEYALGLWAPADEHLTEGLRVTNDPWIQSHRSDITSALKVVKTNVGRVEITGEPEGAEVLVNGKVVGRVPLAQPVRVAAGSVDVELRSPGFRRGFRTVAVAGGQYQPVVIRLEKDLGRAGGNGVPPPADPSEVGARDGDEPGAGAEAQAWRPWVLGAAIGGAALAAGVGVFGYLRHDSKVGEFNQRDCAETPMGVVKKPDIKDPGCVNLNTDYRNARTISIVGFATAGVLAATALVLYVTTPAAAPASEGELEARAEQLPCAPGGDVTAPGVLCRWRF